MTGTPGSGSATLMKTTHVVIYFACKFIQVKQWKINEMSFSGKLIPFFLALSNSHSLYIYISFSLSLYLYSYLPFSLIHILKDVVYIRFFSEKYWLYNLIAMVSFWCFRRLMEIKLNPILRGVGEHFLLRMPLWRKNF